MIGASSDLKSATRVATNMVMKWGMSDSIGPIDHAEREVSDLSPETRKLIDSEIRRLLEVSFSFFLSFFFLFLCNHIELF